VDVCNNLEKKEKKMATENTNAPLFTIEDANRSYYYSQNFKTYADAEKAATKRLKAQAERLQAQRKVDALTPGHRSHD